MATKTKEGAAAHSDTETAAQDATAVEETARAGSGDGHPEPEADGAATEDLGEEAGPESDAEPEAEGELEGDGEPEAKVPSGVGQGAGAVVSAALGLVSLSGGWIGTVAGARQQLVGQLQTSSTATVAKQIKAVYGDAWHSTAMWAGVFALAALLTGVVVLVRPAFGTPGRPQTPWIKSVAWAGVSLGVIGLVLAVLKYSDALLALPSAG
ncbi:hypothetical protein AB0D11_31275 [Streptomyces monashensis]|uniref:hypothetical protein n=1 Tax=Streptomyces monashensis TaxID=1678012 RepID=UPI003407D200